jgi:hypothetical protein
MTRFSSASFSDFASKSKIPPELVAACFEVGDAVGDGVEAFCFHEMLSDSGKKELYPRGRAVSPFPCVRAANCPGLNPYFGGILTLLSAFNSFLFHKPILLTNGMGS